MSVQSNYRIVPYQKNDEFTKKLVRLWFEVGKWQNERFVWFFQDNSYGHPCSWVLENEESEYSLGCISFFLRNFSINNESFLGGVNCDFFVHPKHRTLGPAIQMLKRVVAQYVDFGVNFLLAYPNKNAQSLFRRCGYEEIGSVTRWAKILKSRSILERKISKANYIQKCMWVFDLILKGLSFENYINIFSQKQCKFADNFYEQSDFFFPYDSLHIKNLGKRTIQYLKWRYSIPQTPAYNILGIQKKTDYIGYCCYTNDNGLISLEDLFLSEPEEYFPFALAAFVKFARSQNASSIDIGFMGNEYFENIFKKFGFHAREKRGVLIHTQNDSLFEKLKNSKNWYLMEGDVDL